MFHPTLKLPASTRVHLIQVGVGGNGGYLVQRLSKMLHAFSQTQTVFPFTYMLIDGDMFENKNLLRQPCIQQDMGEFKSKALAERYGTVYEIDILYKDSYIESIDDANKLVVDAYMSDLVVLIGCVDNHATRKIMHQFFMETKHNIVYLDSAIDAIIEDDPESGYSGQVVCGVKIEGKVLLDPVGTLYPDVLDDTESKLPTESCGDTAVNHPQRMMTNEMAAIVLAGYLNVILSDKEIISHYTNFNARTMLSRPTYLSAG